MKTAAAAAAVVVVVVVETRIADMHRGTARRAVGGTAWNSQQHMVVVVAVAAGATGDGQLVVCLEQCIQTDTTGPGEHALAAESAAIAAFVAVGAAPLGEGWRCRCRRGGA